MHSTRNHWLKTSLQYRTNDIKLNYKVPFDVFSGQQIDEGTILLLNNLPKREPSTVLDMGCGYGALGLPVAARFPKAHVELVDRDLLVVDWAAQNAKENGLNNVDAHGSLGYRDLKNGESSKYDWILCNVPARIGTPFIENLVEEGRSKLTELGELAIVVIRDLATVLLELKAKNNWPLEMTAEGPRHTVFTIRASKQTSTHKVNADLYLRDQVEVQSLKLDRPFDLGGDDPKRLKSGLPVLFDSLPRQTKPAIKVFVFRCSYGAIPALCQKRWPDAKITATDRDLLATTFTRRNCPKVEVRDSAYFQNAFQESEKFDLILGELSPGANEKVAEAEILSIASHLEKGGEALILCFDKLEKQWIKPLTSRLKLRIYPVISRDGYTVIRVSP